VLNSLTSPGMVAATLAGVAHGGKVAEISKRDIWSPARVAQERPDVRYQLVAIDFLPGPVRHLVVFRDPKITFARCDQETQEGRDVRYQLYRPYRLAAWTGAPI